MDQFSQYCNFQDLAMVKPRKKLQLAICIASTLAIVKSCYNGGKQSESWRSLAIARFTYIVGAWMYNV